MRGDSEIAVSGESPFAAELGDLQLQGWWVCADPEDHECCDDFRVRRDSDSRR